MEGQQLVQPDDLPQPVLLTFLIADVRGYTRFTQGYGDRAAARLAATFAQMARETVAVHGGEVTELRGDEALAVFTLADGAIRAAAALQSAFREVMQADRTLPLKVGIGVASGDAVPVEGGHRGLALNLAARLCSLAAAGEVYAAERAIELADRIDGLAYVERGRVALKGFEDLVRVIQVLPVNDLPENFPPLVSAVAKPSNLPVQATPFIGRPREVAEISALLQRDDVRLLTLLGPGGTGKTRLSLQAGAALLDHFERGVFFVPLDGVTDPSMLMARIAGTLRVREDGGQSIAEALLEYLRDRQMLLILDNFEHLIEAAMDLALLVGACPRVTIMVTSRCILRLTGEQVFAVPSMTVPASGETDLEALEQYESIALFVRRAQAARTDFSLTADNAAALTAICQKLDGLPLAIELAAARIRLFPPAALLSRLDHRLKVLTGGARDLPVRQQTLQAAIDWSFQLLSGPEQTLFRRLAVFPGGCTIEAAEAVAGADGSLEIDVLDGLAALSDQSLIRQGEDADGTVRFTMLQTLTEYGLERLAESAEEPAIRRRQAEFFLALAEDAETGLRGPEQAEWLARLEDEHDNLRAALTWTSGRGPVEMAVRLAAALHRFWYIHGYFTEGRRWLTIALSVAPDAAPELRAKALNAAGNLANSQADYVEAQAAFEESLALRSALGDNRGRAVALTNLGLLAYSQGQYEDAAVRLEEGRTLFLAVGDEWGAAQALLNLASATLELPQHDRAETAAREALALNQRLGSRQGIARATLTLGFVAQARLHLEVARSLLHESLDLCDEIGDRWGMARSLTNLAHIAYRESDYGRAEAQATKGEALFRAIDDPTGTLEALSLRTEVALQQGDLSLARSLSREEEVLAYRMGNPECQLVVTIHAARARDDTEWQESARILLRVTPDSSHSLACVFLWLDAVVEAACLAGAADAAAELDDAIGRLRVATEETWVPDDRPRRTALLAAAGGCVPDTQRCATAEREELILQAHRVLASCL